MRIPGECGRLFQRLERGLPECRLFGEEADGAKAGANPGMERGRENQNGASNDQLAGPAKHEGAGRARRRHCAFGQRDQAANRPAAGCRCGRDQPQGGSRKGTVDLVRVGPEEADEHSAGLAGGAVVQQDLEALHRITRPGMVARHNDVGRRRGSSLKPAADIGRQELLDRFGPAGSHPEDLSRPADQVADRDARSHQLGGLVNRLAHRVACRVSSQQGSGIAAAGEPLPMQRPSVVRWLVPGKISL